MNRELLYLKAFKKKNFQIIYKPLPYIIDSNSIEISLFKTIIEKDRKKTINKI